MCEGVRFGELLMRAQIIAIALFAAAIGALVALVASGG
jgi:hypothetical protein